MCRSGIPTASAVAAYLGQTVLSANRAVRSNRYIWISGSITTVRRERICRELAAVGRIGMLPRRWLSDKITSAEVVLGNHPIGVRLMVLYFFFHRDVAVLPQRRRRDRRASLHHSTITA
jgi:hypothetical protein